MSPEKFRDFRQTGHLAELLEAWLVLTTDLKKDWIEQPYSRAFESKPFWLEGSYFDTTELTKTRLHTITSSCLISNRKKRESRNVCSLKFYYRKNARVGFQNEVFVTCFAR